MKTKIIRSSVLRSAIICLIISSSPLSAEQHEISLTQSVEFALKNNMDIKAAEKRLEQSAKKVNQAWGDLVPVIETSASLIRQGAENGITSMSDGSYDVRVVQASLSLNPGIFYNSLKIASYENAYCREELRRIRFQVAADATRAYFAVIRARELVKTRKDSRAHLESNYKDVLNLYRNGNVPKLDLLTADIQLKGATPPIMEAEQGEVTAVDNFNHVIGSDGQRYNPEIGFSDVVPKPVLDDGRAIDMITQLALKNRPEIIELDIREKQSGHAAAVQKSTYIMPTFFLSGNWGYNRNLTKERSEQSYSSPAQAQMGEIVESAMSRIAGDDSWQKTWQVRAGATYRWNGLLPFDKTGYREEEEELRSDEIKVRIAQIKESVANSVRRNYFAFKTAITTLDIRKENIATAEEGLRIAKEGYRAGIIRNSELLSAEATLSGTRAAYIDALYNYYAYLAELTREAGSETESILFEDKNHE